MWQRGIKVADGTKVTNELTLTWGATLDYPDRPNVIRSGRRGPRDAMQEGLHQSLRL